MALASGWSGPLRGGQIGLRIDQAAACVDPQTEPAGALNESHLWAPAALATILKTSALDCNNRLMILRIAMCSTPRSFRRAGSNPA